MKEIIIKSYLSKWYLTQTERETLRNEWVINGAWWKGWASFKVIFMELSKELPNFLQDKFEKLINDFELIADYHDLDFYIGWNIFKFILANLKLSYRLHKKLHWTNRIMRFLPSTVCFLVTTFIGYKYFTFK